MPGHRHVMCVLAACCRSGCFFGSGWHGRVVAGAVTLTFPSPCSLYLSNPHLPSPASLSLPPPPLICVVKMNPCATCMLCRTFVLLPCFCICYRHLLAILNYPWVFVVCVGNNNGTACLPLFLLLP